VRESTVSRSFKPVSQAVLAEFFLRSPDLSLVVDAEGWIRSANDAFLAVAPWSGPGTSFLDAHAEASRTRLQVALLSQRAQKTVVAELRATGEQEGGLRLEYRLFPLTGGVFGVVGKEIRRRLSRPSAAAQGRAGLHGATPVSDTDPLTGLWSRERFLGHLEDALRGAAKHYEPRCCVALRVEGLDRVRREEGSEVADALRRATARRLKTLLREHEAVARYAEDRFVFLASACDVERGRALGNHIAREVAMTRFSVCGGMHRVAVRVGCASCADADASAEAILEAADGELDGPR